VPIDLFTKRRIGVCGSSHKLPPKAVPFCEALGAYLARNTLVVIVSGGTRKRKGAPESDLAADWHIVNAAQQVIRDGGLQWGRLEDRIETVLSLEASAEQFHVGTVKHPRSGTSEARRFSFVRGVDALIAVGGGGGSAQEMALAHELEKPVLPVPCFGGTAEEFWKAYRSDLVRALSVKEARAARWEAGATLRGAKAVQALAADMADALLSVLPRRCFPILPFSEDFKALYDFVICGAVRSAGDIPIDITRGAIAGNAVQQIEQGLAACEYAICVLDGLRPNVLYELGMAHARGKPTILLRRKGQSEATTGLPFDIGTQQVIEYECVDALLMRRLGEAIAALPGARR
jgi:predicted Rossmann-fold nucleotide-binding protein